MHSRRNFLKAWIAGGLGAAVATGWTRSAFGTNFITKPIHSSGQMVPVMGLGSWITFNVGQDPILLDECARVMETFFEHGGRMIDSSPMYGSSQNTIGYGLQKLKLSGKVFAADKVWTRDGSAGHEQIVQSRRNWQIRKFDLVQVHNLVALQQHLETLFAMKETGAIRYVGITTSHGRRHEMFEATMKEWPLDFVQLTYNVIDRSSEQRLLPLAREKGISVIVNRPFRGGPLVKSLKRRSVPDWADEIGARHWPEILLKFIISHPAVTCAIPATTRVDHVRENMAAGQGILPDDQLRKRIASHILDS